ncbi:hypothetical protein Anas_04244 [Armadillidium nasatum]|uniref:Uncharacterized protein n=1 Tax=Armadillidium nasatum TaxID=96803 RepID=A0A5N5SJS6_9CRUS|nr:hypothetical protein Anas_04244 [Armadillidium nasatum]
MNIDNFKVRKSLTNKGFESIFGANISPESSYLINLHNRYSLKQQRQAQVENYLFDEDNYKQLVSHIFDSKTAGENLQLLNKTLKCCLLCIFKRN